MYKLFYYDENESKWIYDSEAFDDFKLDQYGGTNQEIPFILILDSNEDDSNKFIGRYVEGKFPKIDSKDGKKIFIYPVFGGMFRVSKKDESLIPIFLLLHVSNECQKMTNITTIVYQIYAFLSVLCDSAVIFLDCHDFLNDQIQFMSNIKSMIKRKNDDNYNKFGDVKQILDISDNEEKKEIEIFSQKVLNKNAKLYCLSYNKSKNKHLYEDEDRSYEEQLKSSSFTQMTELFIITLDDNETCKPFNIQFDNDLKNGSFFELSEMNELFKSVTNMSVMSNLYVNLKLTIKNREVTIKNVFENRLKMINSNLKQTEINLDTLKELLAEIIDFTPNFDMSFRNECFTIINNFVDDTVVRYENILSRGIKKSSQIHISEIKKKISKKLFWNEEQINIIINTHSRFLDNEFFKIIANTKMEALYEKIYSKNKKILEDQKVADKKLLEKIFEQFFIDNETKKSVADSEDADKNRKEKPNYVLKEKEVDKQIRIEIEANNLDKYIKQDF